MRSRIYKFMAIPVFLLSLCVVTVCVGAMLKMPVYAQQADKPQTTVALELNKKNPEENVPFQMTNMFPGDSITHNYKVSVSYTGTITVYFQASVPDGGEKLGEVLMAKVSLPDTGKILYEGSFVDMPAVGYKISTDKESLTEELTYEITLELSTKVGNEYQNKSLSAELNWWAEGADPEDPTQPSDPEGGDDPEDPTQPSNPEGGDDPEDPTQPSLPESEEEPDEPESGGLVNPATGDDSRIFSWLMVMIMVMAVMILLVAGTCRSRLAVTVQEQGQVAGLTKSRRKMIFGMFSVICLTVGLGITSLALVWQKVTVEDNLFVTGQVKISLNDDQPIFREDILFEPGMVVEKEFTLSNDSTCDVHYRLYFTNIDGEFAKMLQVEVLDQEETIFEGTLGDINGQKSQGAHGVLGQGEDRVMTIVFRVPKDCKNEMQGQTILFDLNADAVQAVNNPDGLFE